MYQMNLNSNIQAVTSKCYIQRCYLNYRNKEELEEVVDF